MPDASFNEKISLSGALATYLFVLGPYSMIPIAVASRWASEAQEISGERAFVAITMFIIGCMLMMVADA